MLLTNLVGFAFSGTFAAAAALPAKSYGLTTSTSTTSCLSIKNINGTNYQIECNTKYIGGDIWAGPPLTTDNFKCCIRQCNTYPGCVLAQFEERTKNCLFKGFLSIPVFAPGFSSAKLDTAIHKREADLQALNAVGLAKREANDNRGKRGILYTDPGRVRSFRGSNSKITWGWNWYSSPNGQNCKNNAFASTADGVNGLRFIPNMWSSTDQCLFDVWGANVEDGIANHRTDALIAFNEPDMCGNGGSCISVNDAVAGYRSLMQKYAGRVQLGAPAVSYTEAGWNWLLDFLSACTGCRIDFIPMHLYQATWQQDGQAVMKFQDQVKGLYEAAGHRSIWITEMHYAASEGSEVWWLHAMMDFFEGQDYVGRYTYGTAEGMTMPDGSLTRVGWEYANWRSGGSGDTYGP